MNERELFLQARTDEELLGARNDNHVGEELPAENPQSEPEPAGVSYRVVDGRRVISYDLGSKAPIPDVFRDKRRDGDNNRPRKKLNELTKDDMRGTRK